jgi:hypothetical protein
MIVRMANADASEAARELARARWGDAVLRRAVAVVVERSADLDDTQRAELEAAVSKEAHAGE